MDQSTSPPQQSRNQTPAPRDMMFCHECHDEWYRDEHGLTCPECGSDFTEIIEENNDPRDNVMDHDHDDDDNDSVPSLEEAPPLHPFHDHNPWRDDDPAEGDISNLRWTRVGPTHFNVTATIHRTVSPQQLGRNGGGGGNGPSTIGDFASLLSSIIGGAHTQGQQQNQAAQGNQSAQANPAGEGQGASRSQSQSPPGLGRPPGVHRFAYTSTARLHPRDPNNPGPHMEPTDQLNNVLADLMTALGGPPGAQPQQERNHPHDHGHDHDFDFPFNPLMGLIAHMMPGSGQAGDFVYSQEALDRIISQLMEQNATGNAPGPATQSDINSLPRKPVTEEMLGAEHRAECSICMDEVNIGEEVTELPCKHWFHHQCVSAWLSEHDTCPHCRQGISKHDENANNGPADAGTASPGSNPSRSMPGAFGVTGEGTVDNPFIVAEQPQSPSQNQSQSSGAEDTSSGGGLSERWRRSLFGPQR